MNSFYDRVQAALPVLTTIPGPRRLDDALIKELERRNLPAGATTDEATEDLNRIFYAFYFGKESEAIHAMRKYVQDVTGKVLP